MIVAPGDNIHSSGTEIFGHPCTMGICSVFTSMNSGLDIYPVVAPGELNIGRLVVGLDDCNSGTPWY